MLEQILSPTNMNQAYKRVKSNKGSGGIDKMEVESLRDYLVTNKDELIQSILGGSYRPNPVRRVEIPKENGKIRMLGIPTVIDRVVQQSITQILSPSTSWTRNLKSGDTVLCFMPMSGHSLQKRTKCQTDIDECHPVY